MLADDDVAENRYLVPIDLLERRASTVTPCSGIASRPPIA